jgi:hypothetical protein
VERQRPSMCLAALPLTEAALREVDAALWAFGAAMLTPAARQAQRWEGLRRSLAAALMERRGRGRDRFPDRGVGGEPGSMRAPDPTWAGAADGGRSRRGGGGPAPRHRNSLRRSPRPTAPMPMAAGPTPTIPSLCASPRSSRVPTSRPRRGAYHALRGGQIRGGPGRCGGRDRPPGPRQPPDGGCVSLRIRGRSRHRAGTGGRLAATGGSRRGAAPEDPVLFVTGLPRSGTTLVETILAAHPEVTAGARCRTCRARWHRRWRPCGRARRTRTALRRRGRATWSRAPAAGEAPGHRRQGHLDVFAHRPCRRGAARRAIRRVAP